jgi:hypothetical protein
VFGSPLRTSRRRDRRASVKRLTIEEREVKRLKVTGLEVAGEKRPMV